MTSVRGFTLETLSLIFGFFFFKDDQSSDTAEVRTAPSEEAETHRQEEKAMDVSVEEALTAQVANEARLHVFNAPIQAHFHTCP